MDNQGILKISKELYGNVDLRHWLNKSFDQVLDVSTIGDFPHMALLLKGSCIPSGVDDVELIFIDSRCSDTCPDGYVELPNRYLEHYKAFIRSN